MWKIMLNGGNNGCYGCADTETKARAIFEMRLSARPNTQYSFSLINPAGAVVETKDTIKVGVKK